MAATMRPREREAPAPGKPVPDLPAGQTAKPRLAGRPDPARPGRRLGPAGRVVVTGAVCFGLWALLAAPTLRRAAETSPLGVRPTVALDAKGGFVVKIDARQATGLARPDYFDWRAQVAADVRSFKPNVVLAMFGGNDDQNFIAGGQGYVLGSTGWRDVYGERVGRIMN